MEHSCCSFHSRQQFNLGPLYFTKFTVVTRSKDIQMYPEKLDMESMVVNGTFDWSKTAKSVLFLKKHKCARRVISNIQHTSKHTHKIYEF